MKSVPKSGIKSHLKYTPSMKFDKEGKLKRPSIGKVAPRLLNKAKRERLKVMTELVGKCSKLLKPLPTLKGRNARTAFMRRIDRAIKHLRNNYLAMNEPTKAVVRTIVNKPYRSIDDSIMDELKRKGVV
jgi:hypothetical protein